MTNQVFLFDRYVDGRKMAQGAKINHARTEAEAVEIAMRLLRDDGATDDEISRTKFVLRTNGQLTDQNQDK